MTDNTEHTTQKKSSGGILRFRALHITAMVFLILIIPIICVIPLRRFRISRIADELSSNDPAARRAAAEKLGNFHDTHALDSMIQALDEKDPATRAVIAQSIRRVAWSGGRPSITDAAASAAISTAQYAAGAWTPLAPAARYFQNALNRQRPQGRKLVDELADRTPDLLIPPEGALKDGDRETLLVALGLLRRTDSPKANLVLSMALENPDWDMRRFVAGWLNARRYYPDDPRRLTVFYLLTGRLKLIPEIGEPAVYTLLEAINTGDVNLRDDALSALGQMQCDGGVKALISLASHDDAEIAAASLYEFGKRRPREALPAIIRALDHKDVICRIAAWSAIARYGEWQKAESATPEIIATLAEKMETPDSFLRQYVFDAAACIGGPELTDALLQQASHKNSANRYAAVIALGRIGGERATAALEKAALDPDAAVRIAAQKALENSRIKAERAADK
ncbi:MAG TPA: HEAT repeat domain-containing protein [Candidatus Brocadiia bacterium]|nr:HEAT repeat domain-containing protein [Candidatus Brocadiia bacterium]